MAAFRQQKFRAPVSKGCTLMAISAGGVVTMAMNGVESSVWKRLQAQRKRTMKRKAGSGEWRVAGGWWTFMVTEFSRL